MRATVGFADGDDPDDMTYAQPGGHGRAYGTDTRWIFLLSLTLSSLSLSLSL